MARTWQSCVAELDAVAAAGEDTGDFLYKSASGSWSWRVANNTATIKVNTEDDTESAFQPVNDAAGLFCGTSAAAFGGSRLHVPYNDYYFHKLPDNKGDHVNTLQAKILNDVQLPAAGITLQGEEESFWGDPEIVVSYTQNPALPLAITAKVIVPTSPINWPDDEGWYTCRCWLACPLTEEQKADLLTIASIAESYHSYLIFA